MKKYFILAAAALVALTACSKIDVPGTAENSKKISFEVANYTAQTKAGSLAAEGFYNFHTYATQFPEIGTASLFMSNVEVDAWDNEATPAVVLSGNGIYTWAPQNDYYWPKTGYINFYSYAGTKNPTATISDDKKTVTFDYGTVTVAPNDNILVADAALRFNANTNPAKYKPDATVTKGVPTMFRRQLAHVIFKVHLKTTQPASSNTTWKVRTIASETINEVEYKSQLTFFKNGSLKLQNVDALADNATMNTTEQVWTAVVGENANVDGWIAETANEDKEVITLTSNTLTIAVNKQESEEEAPAYFVAERSVMPQATSNTKFVLYYEVTASHDNFATDPFLKEIRSVGVDVEKSLADLASSITAWNKNKVITYNIIIDPVSEKVLFDPAVEDWSDAASADILPRM